MSDETLLIISEVGVPLYSARGLTQTLTPSPEAKPAPKRTINGELRWLGVNGTVMKKYDSTITCGDQNAPALDNVWPGDIVTVACVHELAYPTSLGSPQRDDVSGSSRSTSDGFTYYRPIITFMVIDKEESNEEYKHEYKWKLTLREV